MTDQTPLRDRVAKALADEDARACGWGHGFLERYGADAETDGFVDAVLAVLPAPVDRRAVLLEGAAAIDATFTGPDTDRYARYAADLLRRMADETAATETQADVDLATRLEAALTERYTELGNPFSRMRRQEQGPDGWPAEHPVGPHHVAETLRELLAAGARQDGAQP